MSSLKDNIAYVKNYLSDNDVEKLLNYYNGQPRRYNNVITAKTVCHHGEKRKLYYYINSKLFHCYTDCSCSMDIIELVKRINHFSTAYDSYLFLVEFFNIEIKETNCNYSKILDWEYFDSIKKNQKLKEIKIVSDEVEQEYSEKLLKNFKTPRIKLWEKEGINSESLKHHKIKYCSSANSILIPHYDINNKFIGLRERSLNIEDIEKYGKYHPVKLNGVTYKHPLSHHLYNLNNVKKNISKTRSACLFESEKSCLQFESFYGQDKDISVAICGSNISKKQTQLLKNLGVQEMIVCLDKEFENLNDDLFKKQIIKLKKINKEYGNEFKVSFVFDKWGKLKYKDSPTDRGKENFEYLLKERVCC